MSRCKALWMVPALCVFLAGCSGAEALRRSIDADIARGEYASAVERLRKNPDTYGEKNAVLYNLDMGLLYHYIGEPDSSIGYLLRAEKGMEDLYTKSITTGVMSFLLNDNVIPYDGDDHDKVLVNLFLALSFAEKGLADEALVEARKVDLKLREYTRQYDGKNTYKEDAFIRYITGALYENAGEVNDAFIAYRNSYEAYKAYEQQYGIRAPGFLLDDIVRTATLMSFEEEREQFEKLGGAPFDRKRYRKEGSILVVAYVGQGPVKEQIKPQVTIADTAGILHTFQIALPKFVTRYRNTRSYDVTIAGARDTVGAVAEPAEDITAIAGKALDERLAMVYLKSGGRAILKFLAAEKAKSEIKKSDSKLANVFGSLAVDLLIGATEQADTRSWRTLPAQIHLARIQVPEGAYRCNVEASDGRYTLRDIEVTVQPGKVAFVIVDDVR